MMLQFDTTKNAYLHVPVANLVGSSGAVLRSFSTSRQMIEFMIQEFASAVNTPRIDYLVVANGPLGPQVAGLAQNYAFLSLGSGYVKGADADIVCGQHLIYDSTNGLWQSPESGGNKGWG